MYTLVTGATSDIGKQICNTLVNAGHTLLLIDLSEDALIDLCNSLPGEGHLFISLDFSDISNTKERLQSFIKEKEINCCSAVFAAGIFAVRPLKMLDLEFCRMNFDIAILSIILIMQILIDKRVNGKNLRSVVMISSVSAKKGSKGYSMYSAVKSAMLGLMRSLTVELAPQTRINAVVPGGIHTKSTDFIYKLTPEIDKRYVLGQGFPEDVANAVTFMLSDNARWITGQEIVVDGGWSIN